MSSFIPHLKGVTMRRALNGVLLSQAVLAGLLLLSDFGGRLTDALFYEEEDVTMAPVTPGDQRRHYNPRRSPMKPLSPADGPLLELPSELPERLEFSIQQVNGVGELLIINGAIEEGDAKRFIAFYESLNSPLDGVAINSPGGSVYEALSIGRTLRQEAMNTYILPATFCVSACPYILAGGVDRMVSLQGAVGMHQHYYDAPGYMPVFLAVEDIQHGQGRTMEYLIEMGIDPGLMLYSLNTPPDDIYVLIEEELISTNLATEVLE